MKPVTPFSSFPEFANAGARAAPDEGKYAAGFVPADTLPAEWANYFFHGATKGVSDLNAAVLSIWTELTGILTSYGISASGEDSAQLLGAIRKIYPQFAECTTQAAAAQKSISVQGAVLKPGCSFVVTMAEANAYGDGTATYPTLSVNSGTPYPICDAGGKYQKAGAWAAGDVVTLLFTGTRYLMQAQGVTDTIALGNYKPVTSNAVAQSISQSSSLTVPCSRWLRFSAANKKALTVKAGTVIKVGTHLYSAASDMIYDLSASISAGGTDYFVYLNWAAGDVWTLSLDAQKTADTDERRYIGRFHTLCASIPADTTMIVPAPPSSGIVVGTKYLVKPYREDTDADFYGFYNKDISAISTGTYYDVLTCAHPLAGFSAGDILPESVWCLTFRPDTLFDDAMVFEPSTKTAIDVYLQSGKGRNTRSQYNAVHAVSQAQVCHESDMLQVGKRLISDEEFQAAALGSNEGTAIQGAADQSTVGGHVDTAGRRMTSATGCEEMCGYLWQWQRDVTALGNAKAWYNGNYVGASGWITIDSQNAMGQMYNCSSALLAGGHCTDGASCGSRARLADSARSAVRAIHGGRGSSRVTREAQ